MDNKSAKIDEQELRDRLALALGDGVDLSQFYVVYAFQKLLFGSYCSYALAFSLDEGMIWVLNLDSSEVSRMDLCDIRRVKEKFACEYMVVRRGLHRHRQYCVPLLTGNPQIHQCTQIEGAQAFKVFCERINKSRSPITGSLSEAEDKVPYALRN